MLKSLSIHNFVLIESLHLEFEEGFSVFTGETGTGKSILLDALSQALGEKTDTSLIRVNTEASSIIAEFILPPSHPLFPVLQEQGFLNEEDKNHLILRRILNRDGKSRAFLNDIPVKPSFLKMLGASLLEIHGQFDRLLNAPEHRAFLDTFGNLDSLSQETEKAFKDWKETTDTLKTQRLKEQEARETYEIWGHHLEELKAFNPLPQEEETLLLEREKLLNQHKFQKALEEVSEIFEREPSLESQILHHHKTLGRYETSYPDVSLFLENLDRCLFEIRESQSLLEKIHLGLPKDAALLEKTEDRLSELRGLARKHHVPPSELSGVLTSLLQKFSAFENQSSEIKELEILASQKRSLYETFAFKLSQERLKAAKALEDFVQKKLPSLKLERALFKVLFKELPSEAWNGQGREVVEFHVAPNGVNFGSLKDIASGGELSRLLLALKVALSQRQDISVIIFDEIDSGVSGAVSSSIGRCLERLSCHIQVIAITHAPQVASHAHHHFLVEKLFEKDIPTTRVSLLDISKRKQEIARMLSGDEITEEARAAAQRLLER